MERRHGLERKRRNLPPPGPLTEENLRGRLELHQVEEVNVVHDDMLSKDRTNSRRRTHIPREL